LHLYSNSTGNHNSRSKSKKQLNKSASSADHLDKTGGFETSVAPPVALGRRGFSLERPLENIEKKKSASESNLLAAATSSNDIAPTTADTGHSVAFIQKFVSQFFLSKLIQDILRFFSCLLVVIWYRLFPKKNKNFSLENYFQFQCKKNIATKHRKHIFYPVPRISY
jgi:hypothetical protein